MKAKAYDPAEFFSAERRERAQEGEAMAWDEIARLTQSKDHRARHKAEYWFVKRKFDGLSALLKKWDAGTLGFTPDCPRSIY